MAFHASFLSSSTHQMLVFVCACAPVHVFSVRRSHRQWFFNIFHIRARNRHHSTPSSWNGFQFTSHTTPSRYHPFPFSHATFVATVIYMYLSFKCMRLYTNKLIIDVCVRAYDKSMWVKTIACQSPRKTSFTVLLTPTVSFYTVFFMSIWKPKCATVAHIHQKLNVQKKIE